MAFYLGNFTGGLFNGAQTVLGLYSAYQGIMQTERDVSAADEVKKAREDQDALDKAKQPATQTPAPTTAQPPADKPADQTTPPPTLDRHDDDQAKPDAKPVNVPKVKAVTGPTEEGTGTTSTDPYRPSITTGLPKPLYPPAPFNAAGVAGAPGTPSGPAVVPPATLPPQVPLAQVSQETGLPLPQQTAPPAPQQPPAARPVVGADPNFRQPPQALPTYPAEQPMPPRSQTLLTPPPSVTEPVPGYLSGRAAPVPGVTVAPVYPPPQTPQPRSQVPPPVMPADQAAALEQAKRTGQSVPFGTQGQFVNPDGTLGAPPMAPVGGGGAAGRGTPMASAEPPSIGGKIASLVSNLNPFGTAQAAEQPPPGAKASDAAPNAPAEQLRIAQEQAKASNAPVKMADGRTVNPNGTVDNPPAQAPAKQGITPAEPPKTTNPPAPQTPPVKVEDTKESKVAPNQAGPSVQSSSTPPALAPAISPRAWQWAQQNRPDLAKLIQEVVDQHGGGVVSYQQVAAIIDRESNWQVNAQAHGTMGAGQGLMQIEPGTQKDYNLGGKLDPFNARDNITMGVTMLKDLAVGPRYNLGSGTVQQNLVYMRGMGGLAEVRRTGWDAYAATHAIPRNAMAMMYGQDAKIGDGHFPGGSEGASATASARDIVNAGHQSGPDGVLDLISRTGPAGMGMTDRWRSAQAALEYAAIAGGHMDRLPMIQDWISQQSHQGVISNLMVAYNGILSGNAQVASDALARGHAFFPDGTWARFGPDKSGHIWAQQFSDATGHELGKPFQVTPEAVLGQIVALQNPATFAKTVQQMQLTTAQIDQLHAHADYYRTKPKLDAQVREDAIEQRREAHADTVETRRAIAGQTDATRRAAIERQRQADELRAETAAGNTAREEAPVNKHITDLYGTDADPAHKAAPPVQAELHRAFMYPPRSGGAGLTTKSAEEYATGLIGDKPKYALKPGVDVNGKPGYAITDADGKNPHATITQEMGDKLLAHPGVNRIAGAQRIAQPPGPQQHTSAVGAGSSSYAALQGGYNQNISNMPTQALPQLQPQQTMAA